MKFNVINKQKYTFIHNFLIAKVVDNRCLIYQNI